MLELIRGDFIMKPVISKKKVNPRELHKKYLNDLESGLENQGVVFFEVGRNLNISSDYLTLPAQITEVSSRDLGEYLNAFTQQKLYLRTLLGRTEIWLEEAKRSYVVSSERIYKELSNGKLSETAKERIINADEEVKPHYYEYVDWIKKRDLLLYSISNVEDAIFLLSREVSRRSSDFDDENRSYNVTKR